MNVYNSPRQIYVSMAFPQGMTEALERLHTENPDSALESVYIYDLVERQTLWASNSVTSMLGYGEDDTQIMGPMGLVNLIHPDDLETVLDHYQKFDTLKSGTVIVAEYRMKRADGSWGRLRSQETPLAIAVDGLPVQILGILQDLSEGIPIRSNWDSSFDHSIYDVN
jgi:PAS domain-containing protein